MNADGTDPTGPPDTCLDGLFAESPADMPVPPLRIARIRLESVGPDGARFDPLDLDFATVSGAASRVLLSLTNTGGKSTLITLVSSLIVPAARSQVGGKNLGDYVLTNDTSHVVVEWEDSSTGQSTVTGTVMEWRDGRRQPGHRNRSTSNMRRAWYLFRSGPELAGIDDLPFRDGSRRTPFETFTAAVSDLVGGRSELGGVVAHTQADWSAALAERTNIDPVLFSYQMRMNDSESGAQKLLESFDSPDHVVRFFVAALNDERHLADFTAKLTSYAEVAGKRPRLQALATFGTEAVPAVERVAARAAEATKAAAEEVQARTAAAEHTAAVSNRVEYDSASLVELEAERDDAQQRASTARAAYGRISDIRNQLLHDAAKAARETAAAALDDAESREQDAARNADAWAAVDLVVAADEAETALAAAQADYEAADAGLDGLRAAVQAAAGAYGARLAAVIVEAEQDRERLEAEADEAQERRDRARAEAKDAEDRVRAVERDLADGENAVAAAEEAVAAATVAGWLRASETPSAARDRWEDTRADQAELSRTAAAREADAVREAGTARDRLEDLEPVAEKASVTLRTAEQALDDFETELATFDADEVVALAGDVPDGPGDVARIASLAVAAAADADRAGAVAESAAQTARDELAHLDQTGTAPTGPDVVAVREAIAAADIGAVTGLDWIVRNVADPDDRAAFIEARPDVAGGVVVADPSRFAAAVDVLTDAAVATSTPVTVTTAPSAADAVDDDASLVHVVVPHRATWDRAWATRRRAELAEIAEERGSAASSARERASRLRLLESRCTTFDDRWGHTDRARLAGAVAEAAAAADDIRREREALRTSVADAEQTRVEARADRDRADDRARAAVSRRDEAATLAEQVADAEQARERRDRLGAALSSARDDVDAAGGRERQAERERNEAAKAAVHAEHLADRFRDERVDAAVDAAETDPGGSLDVLRTRWRSERDRLDGRERGLPEAATLETARRARAETRDRLERVADVAEDARVLATSTEATSPPSLRAAQDRARAGSASATTARLEAADRLEKAERAVLDAAPGPDRHVHFDLANTPEWQPGSPQEIPEVLERLEVANVELRAAWTAAQDEANDAVTLADAVAEDVTVMSDIVEMWPGDSVPTSKRWDGTAADARSTMTRLRRAHDDADADARAASDALDAAVDSVHAVVSAPAFIDLPEPAAQRLRRLSKSDLAAEAETLARRIDAVRASAVDDLDELDEHRDILRGDLFSLCADQRRLLREVSRSSRLPDEVGELSQAPTIKISFDDAPDDEAAGRLAVRIDSWALELAENPKRVSSPDARARWLADAVRDTVVDRPRAGPFSIEVLKPSIDGQIRYCPPDRIPDEFSGGQVLTLAVLVYCALSAVRSSHRPGGARPPGCLILDNPFGAASAETLIAMQHRLAAANGLQLLCATGLHDAGVVDAFCGPGSVIVKLRNDADVRRNRKFLRVRDATVDGVDVDAALSGGRALDDPAGYVDGIAYRVPT